MFLRPDVYIFGRLAILACFGDLARRCFLRNNGSVSQSGYKSREAYGQPEYITLKTTEKLILNFVSVMFTLAAKNDHRRP